MSTLAIDTIQGATTATSVNMSGVTNLQMPAGHVLQTIAQNADGAFASSSTSWVNTGLISLTFPNNLQATSKVLVRIHLTFGEEANSSWANRSSFTIFENSTNKGDDSLGIVNGSAHHQGNSNTTYETARVTGEELFTPSVLNGTYALYFRANVSFARAIGRPNTDNASYSDGKTQVVLQEIAG